MGTIVRSWVLGGVFAEDLGHLASQAEVRVVGQILPRPPPPAPEHTPDFCRIQAVNEKFAQPTCCLRGEILSGVPLVFGGALQFQVSTAEYRVWRKSSGWRMGDEAMPCPVEESDECLLLKVNWGVSQ